MGSEIGQKPGRRSGVGYRLIMALMVVFGVYLISTTITVYALITQYWGFKELSDTQFGRAMTAAELTRDAEVLANEAFGEMLGIRGSFSADRPGNSDLILIFETARASLAGASERSLADVDKWQQPYLDSLANLRQSLVVEREQKARRLSQISALLKLGDEVRSQTGGDFAQTALAAISAATAALSAEQPGQISELHDRAEAALQQIGQIGQIAPQTDAMTGIAARLVLTVRQVFDTRLPSLQSQRATLAAARQTSLLAQKLTSGTVNYYLDVKRSAQAATLRHQEIARVIIVAVILFMVISVGATLLVIIYIIRSVIRRLNRLNQAMSAHVRGDGGPIPIIGQDEIGDMGHAFKVFVTARDQAERALLSAREDAERANQAKSDFLANMSHEIRTPLAAINGFATLIRQGSLSPKQSDYVEKILRSAEHLSRVINDILDFSKIEAGHFDLDQSPFNLHEILDTVADILVDGAEAKGLAFEMITADGLPQMLIGDRLRLVQVLVNLAGNAIKFTDHGKVTVSTVIVEDDGVDAPVQQIKLCFSVADTGIGMTPAQIAGLFGKFHQVDTSITRRFGGTGLGLAISKHLVEMMGGEIIVSSELGIGSIFAFTLRFDRVPSMSYAESDVESRGLISGKQEEITMPGSDAMPSLIEWPDLAGRRVLLVDDQPFNRQIATAILEQQDILVEPADGGRAAVKRVLAVGPDYFDAVLMDVQMPDMDGLEATRQIRQHYSAALLPVIAMTAQSLDEQRQACFAAGMNDHVAKPIIVENLWSVLQHWVKPHAQGALARIDAGGASASDLPDRLDGFDLAAGISQLGGNPVLFKKMLADFPKWALVAETQLERVLDRIAAAGSTPTEEDFKEIELAAHSLVGMAASVAAVTVTTAALALEQAARQGEASGFDRRFRRLRGALHEAYDRIADITGPMISTEPKPELAAVAAATDPDGATAPDDNSDLAEIIRLLEQQDFDAERRFDQFRHKGPAGIDPRQLQAIAQAIDDLNFRRAAFLARHLLDGEAEAVA